MAEKYFTVDGVATFVHHRGPTTLPGTPPASSGGATVLCLHDAAGNGHVFTGLLDALSGEASPIAFDLPGHGRSGGLDSLGRIEAMAAHAHWNASNPTVQSFLPRPVMCQAKATAVATHNTAAMGHSDVL